MSNSKLVNVTKKAHSSNYTKGRTSKISKITLHHMAAVLTAAQCGALFQKKGREASSTYGVGSDAKIGLYVDEKDTPYTDGNYASNCKSITIEVSNSKTGGNWPVSDKTLNALIKLVADIAKRNNIKLVKGKTLTWHSMYVATTCPGNYLRSKMDYIIQEANKINNPEKKDSASKTTSTTLKKGDYVEIISKGNARSDGKGATSNGIGYKRYINAVLKNATYPYDIGTKKGVRTGFYKKSALKKIK